MKIRVLPDSVSVGEEYEVQLAPLGEWPGRVDGRAITQVFDAEACSRVVENFSHEILVDADHNSVREGGDTSAMAWVSGLRNDTELGLVGIFRFTPKGAEVVNSRTYRFVSVCWLLDAHGRPYELDSVALTNRPNLPVRPVLNRSAGINPVAFLGDLNYEESTMNIREILGLAAEASEEEVAKAVKALVDRIAKLEADAMEAEATEFAAANSAEFDAEALKAAYLAAPDAAKALVKAVRKAPKQQVLNSKAATCPAIKAPVKREELAALPPNERAAFYRAHAAEIDG